MRSKLSRRRLALGVAGLGGLVLAGCGQKGPLFFAEDLVESKTGGKKKESEPKPRVEPATMESRPAPIDG